MLLIGFHEFLGLLTLMKHLFYILSLVALNCLTTFVISIFELRFEISNNVVYASDDGSDQPSHMSSLIRVFASHLNIQ